VPDDPALTDPDGHFPYARDRAEAALRDAEPVAERVRALRERANEARSNDDDYRAYKLDLEADDLEVNLPVTTQAQIDACERIVLAEEATRQDPSDPLAQVEYQAAVEAARALKADRVGPQVVGGVFRAPGTGE
jgi:uncharacterized protein YcbX